MSHIIQLKIFELSVSGKTEVKSTQYDKDPGGQWITITDVRHKFNFEETTHQYLILA